VLIGSLYGGRDDKAANSHTGHLGLQPVAIAPALATEPAIVLADEPTGNLDSKTGKAIMQLLRRSCHELHQTIVVVTRHPQAAAYGHRIVFLADGQGIGETTYEGVDEMGQRLRIVMDAMEKFQL
jgi:putative ABC transport system ATP-binding protein